LLEIFILLDSQLGLKRSELAPNHIGVNDKIAGIIRFKRIMFSYNVNSLQLHEHFLLAHMSISQRDIYGTLVGIRVLCKRKSRSQAIF